MAKTARSDRIEKQSKSAKNRNDTRGPTKGDNPIPSEVPQESVVEAPEPFKAAPKAPEKILDSDMLTTLYEAGFKPHSWESEYIDFQSYEWDDDLLHALRTAYQPLRQICPTCSGNKQYRNTAGKIVNCDCPHQRALAKWYALANLPEPFWRLGWDHFVGSDKDVLNPFYAYLHNHLSLVENGWGLMINSQHGGGKTFFATLVAKELIKVGWRVFYLPFTILNDRYFGRNSSGEERRSFEDQILNTKILVLDNLIKPKNNMLNTAINEILDTRLTKGRPTFITTSEYFTTLEGEYGPIIASQQAHSIVVSLPSVDYKKVTEVQALRNTLTKSVSPII